MFKYISCARSTVVVTEREEKPLAHFILRKCCILLILKVSWDWDFTLRPPGTYLFPCSRFQSFTIIFTIYLCIRKLHYSSKQIIKIYVALKNSLELKRSGCFSQRFSIKYVNCSAFSIICLFFSNHRHREFSHFQVLKKADLKYIHQASFLNPNYLGSI